MTMHEGERLAYLQALGITQFVPLRPVEGALQLPEPEWETDSASSPETAGADASAPSLEREQLAHEEPPRQPATGAQQDTRTAADAVAESVATLVRQAESSAVVQTPAEIPPAQHNSDDIPQLDLSKLKPAEESPRATTPKPATLQRFALAVVTLPQRTRLLVELARHDAPGLSGVEFRMLGDLLLALNVKQDLSEGALRLYRWPLVNNPRIAADASAARDGLLAFLAAAQAEQSVEKLVFLGTAALSCFPHQQVGNPFNLPDVENAACLFSHSLTALQKDWALKPEVWHQLQAFL